MKAGSCANVASSFTVMKCAMSDETSVVFATWDFERSKRENLDRLRDESFIGVKRTISLRDVAKVLNRRFEPDGRDHRSFTIAHGLEHVFWVEGADGRWSTDRTPTKCVDELMKARTSPLVKSALKSLLEATLASGMAKKTKKGKAHA